MIYKKIRTYPIERLEFYGNRPRIRLARSFNKSMENRFFLSTIIQMELRNIKYDLVNFLIGSSPKEDGIIFFNAVKSIDSFILTKLNYESKLMQYNIILKNISGLKDLLKLEEMFDIFYQETLSEYIPIENLRDVISM